MNWDRIEGDSKHFKGRLNDRRFEMDDVIDDKHDAADKRHSINGKKQEMQFNMIDESEHQLSERQGMPKSRKHIRKPEHSINKMVKK